MRSRLKERLRKLEMALAINLAAESCPSPAAEIAARIAAWGFVPGPCESLAETLARAFGISCRELHSQLIARDPGHPRARPSYAGMA